MAKKKDTLRADYPWARQPLVVGAPMMKLTLAPFAVALSAAGGIGFVAGGFDLSSLEADVAEAAKLIQSANPAIPSRKGILPIGIGFQNWGSDLEVGLRVIETYLPAAAWFFAPAKLPDLVPWTERVREATDGKTKIWIQVGSVADAIEVAKTCRPDVLVVQGSDAGGHGLAEGAGIVSLLPEVDDALEAEGITDIPLVAAGGMSDGRGMAAALTLGAVGVAMGTRFLASSEVTIARGYQDEVLRVGDGGVSTVRTKLYDTMRGIHGWPAAYNGRGVVNERYPDKRKGLADEKNMEKYKETMQLGDRGWGPHGRRTTYAGTAVGLVKGVSPVAEIVKEILEDVRERLRCSAGMVSKL